MNERRASYLVLATAVFLATLAVHASALRNDFVLWDDNVDVYGNIHIRSLDGTFLRWAFSTAGKGLWEPMTWISYALEHSLWGPSPFGYHLTSIVLHALNAFLVVLLVAGLCESAAAGKGMQGRQADRTSVLVTAGVTAVLFGIHPLQVESVAWVSARPAPLYAFFFLLGTLAYLRAVRSAEEQRAAGSSRPAFLNGWYLLVFFLFLLSLGSKASAAAFPVVLLILDWYPLGRMGTSRRALVAAAEKIPFLAAGVVIGMVNVRGQQALGNMITVGEGSAAAHILVALNALVQYLEKLLLPLRLVPFYPYPDHISFLDIAYLAPVVLFCGITVSCLAMIKKRPYVLALWLFFFVTLLPALGIVKVREVSHADRYVYLSALGPFLLVGLIADRLRSMALQRGGRELFRILCGLGIVLVLALSWLTVRQTAVWRNSIDLWSYVIEKAPRPALRAYINRGVAYDALERRDRAIDDFSRVIMLGQSAGYTYLAYQYRSMAFAEMGRVGEGLDDLDRAIALIPTLPFAYGDRGLLYAKMGRYESAIADFDRAIELEPAYVDSFVGRGLAFERTGRLEQALADLNKAVGLNPYNADAYLDRGVVLERMGRPDGALSDFTRAVALVPSDALAYSYRARVLGRMGRVPQAIDDLTRAIALSPDPAQAYLDRGGLYRQSGRMMPALEDFRKACELGSEEGCRIAKSTDGPQNGRTRR